MNILDIIEKKRDAKELNKEEIEFFVKPCLFTPQSMPRYLLQDTDKQREWQR